MTNVSIRKRGERGLDKETQTRLRREGHVKTETDWSDTSTSQEMPMIARS